MIKEFVRTYRSLLIFVVLMVAFRSSIADWSDVPTGSMQPTIVEGDRILVNKLAYDIRIPLSHFSLFELSNPQSGDIVIFDSAVSQKRLVKRVIGVPGDTVSLINNRLLINGNPIRYTEISTSIADSEKFEYLTDELRYRVKHKHTGSMLSNFASITVPEKHYLVMGDNRDNSADSRVIGFVPREEIVGRTRRVILSLDYENFFLPRIERFFHLL